MKIVFASSLLAAVALASPAIRHSSSSTRPHVRRELHRTSSWSSPPGLSAGGPCDMSSEDTNCYLISDNSGCFLNTSNVTRVLECVDPEPKAAIDIFCRCWGCNGKELLNFMPVLNCSSHTVIPQPANSTNSSLTLPFPPPQSTTGSVSVLPPAGGSQTGKAKEHTRMPVPVLPSY